MTSGTAPDGTGIMGLGSKGHIPMWKRTDSIRKFSFKRTFRHMITNNPNADMEWLPLLWTLNDGMYGIPYYSKRSAMVPEDLRWIHQNFDAVRVDSVGFTVTASKVQEQEAFNNAVGTVIKSVDVASPRYQVFVDPTGYFTDIELAEDGNLLTCNDEMKVQEPRTRAEKLLKTTGWRMGSVFRDKYGEASLFDGKTNPPINVAAMYEDMPTLDGWSHQHTYRHAKFFPCTDVEFPKGMKKPEAATNPWLQEDNKFPAVLDNEPWSEGAYDPFNQTNLWRDTPRMCCVRLDRKQTRGGVVESEAELWITYNVQMTGISYHKYNWMTSDSPDPTPLQDPWTRSYRRLFSHISARQLVQYNTYAEFDNKYVPTPLTDKDKDNEEPPEKQARVEVPQIPEAEVMAFKEWQAQQKK